MCSLILVFGFASLVVSSVQSFSMFFEEPVTKVCRSRSGFRSFLARMVASSTFFSVLPLRRNPRPLELR